VVQSGADPLTVIVLPDSSVDGFEEFVFSFEICTIQILNFFVLNSFRVITCRINHFRALNVKHSTIYVVAYICIYTALGTEI
jgi:hypothetical protein